jgi:TPR repeat protein
MSEEGSVKGIRAISSVLFALGLARVANAGPYEDGLTAYNLHDYKRALRLYGAAAAQGNAYAQYNLGLMYANGIGITKDYVHAHMWLTLAAASSDQKVAYSILDMVSAKMTAPQISEARAMTRKCEQSHFKQCG